MPDPVADARKLMPCPHCKGEAEEAMGRTGDGQPWPYVECLECGATAETPELWNRRAPVESDRAEEWRPIETAPKDGQYLIIGRVPPWSSSGHVVVGYWNDDQHKWLTQDGGWLHESVWSYWQPLPAPPVSQPKETAK